MTPNKVPWIAVVLLMTVIACYPIYLEVSHRYRTYKWRKEWKQKYPRNKK